MKKFLILSTIVGLAGIGVGVARQDEPAPVEAATLDATSSTTVTTLPPAATISPTTVRKTVAKGTSTPTTARRISTPTTGATTVAGVTATTAQPAATTLSTTATTSAAPPTTTVTAPVATCSVVAANASVHPGDSQTISFTSDKPTTKTMLTIQYPKFNTGKPNPRLEYTLTTDAAGAASKTFSVNETSTVPVSVSVRFYDAATGYLMQGGCQTTFQSTPS